MSNTATSTSNTVYAITKTMNMDDNTRFMCLLGIYREAERAIRAAKIEHDRLAKREREMKLLGCTGIEIEIREEEVN